MAENEKAMRAIYLKGVLVGHEAIIELAVDVGGRDEAGEYVKLALVGSRHTATLKPTSWEVRINDHVRRQTHTVDIPLENGKVRG